MVIVVAVVTALLGVLVAMLVSGLGPPEHSLVVRAMSCQRLAGSGAPLEAEHVVRLPYAAPRPAVRPDIRMFCRFALNLPADRIASSALLIPAFSDSISIQVNGRQVAQSELFTMHSMIFMTLPAYAPLPPDALRPGPNGFAITVSARPARTASLGLVYVGPKRELLNKYRARWFAAAVYPTLIMGGETALAVVFGLIWVVRRRETEFGWLALFLVLGAAHGSVLVPVTGIGDPDHPLSNLLILWETGSLLMFLRAIAGVPNTRRTWLLAVPPLAFTVLRLLGSSALISEMIRPGIVVVMVYVVLGVWWLARAAMRGNRDAAVILVGMAILSIFVAHDLMGMAGLIHTGAFLGRGALSALMVMICTLTTLRFLRAMGDLDQAAEAYRVRADTAEAELRATYEELRVRREAEVVERERGRLMRDLHDGVGGELASMLALADSPEPRGAEIALHARAALADMRLIIGSLEDYGGDLALALGAWRERAEPQVRAAGLKLDWRVRDLPPLPGLGPSQVLDILRIVQEGVANAIKHADATRLTVAAYEADAAVVIAVRDDGMGLRESGAGNGLRNMAARAERLGAILELRRNGEATELVLVLPERF